MIVLEMDRRELGLVIDACLEADRLLHDEGFDVAMGVPRAVLSAVEEVLVSGHRAMTSASEVTDASLQDGPVRFTVVSEDLVTLGVSRRDLRMLVDAFVQTDLLVRDWEFEILMGVTRGELAAVKDDLLAALRATPSPRQLPDTSHEEPS